MNIEELSQYSYTKKEIEHMQERIQRLRCQMRSPRAAILSDTPKGSFGDSDQMANNLIKLDELLEKYQELLNELYDKQLRVEKIIENLEPIERDLVRYRYFDGLMWRDVSEKIGYAQRQTFRIHDKILEKLEKMAHSGK